MDKEGEEEEKKEACDDPSAYLANFLSETVSNFKLQELKIERTINPIKTNDIVEVSYEFTKPIKEEEGADEDPQYWKEYRIIELSPNFSAQCYKMQ